MVRSPSCSASLLDPMEDDGIWMSQDKGQAENCPSAVSDALFGAAVAAGLKGRSVDVAGGPTDRFYPCPFTLTHLVVEFTP